MGISLETAVIGVLVLGALSWAARAGYRAVKNSGGCSSCSSSGECPLVDDPEALAALAGKGQHTFQDACHPGHPNCAEAPASREEKKPV